MNICVISDGYPSKDRPEFVFIQHFCNELSKQGHDVSVITPYSITKRIVRKLPKLPFFRQDKVGTTFIDIYSPSYLSFGKHSNILKFARYLRQKSISQTIKKINIKPDIIYGHFWHNGYDAYDIAKKLNIPLFIASGESEISQIVNSYKEKEFCKYVKGVICVSTKNLEESIRKGLTTGENCVVIPNAVNEELFHKLNKIECRNKLGLNPDSFIVSFVGGFIERKGPQRVASAITKLNNDDIKSFFIGSNRDGELIKINCKGILKEGPLPNNEIPIYLNASDVFVLPTLHEGCCNAIIEAMSCGLPIISSDAPFNYDILDKSNAILVDPLNIEEISQAINNIYTNKDYRESLARNSLIKAKELTISKRVKRIIDFISTKINK